MVEAVCNLEDEYAIVGPHQIVFGWTVFTSGLNGWTLNGLM